MTYRAHRTWCTASTCQHFGHSCNRSLTPEVEEAAERWWGGPDAPISMYAEPEKLDCYEPKPEPETDNRKA